MSITPLVVQTRPFAIEPVTNMMLPDGIFDNAIHKLYIACHCTNVSDKVLSNAKIYLESVSDGGIIPIPKTFEFHSIPAGASVLVMWEANFQKATPGKKKISFVAMADGFNKPQRSYQQIWVSQTRFDLATNTLYSTIEEGSIAITDIRAIISEAKWQTDEDSINKRVWIPTGMTMVWKPNPPFLGVHGDLPFVDPCWHKVIALLIALIAGIIAIVTAEEGNTSVEFEYSTEFLSEQDASVACCTPASKHSPYPQWVHAAVVAGAMWVAKQALTVALADFADPFWRGQQETAPDSSDEKTVAEKVTANWELPEAPNAGKAYRAIVDWTYTRITTAKSYEYSVSESQTNTHVCELVEIESIPQGHLYQPIWVRAKFHRTIDTLFKGPELYAFAIFCSPDGFPFLVSLTDNGLDFDPGQNDGIYAGSLHLETAFGVLYKKGLSVLGEWKVYIFAQDVNLTLPGLPPEIAAQTFGGNLIVSPVSLTFNPSVPCPLTPHTTIVVV